MGMVNGILFTLLLLQLELVAENSFNDNSIDNVINGLSKIAIFFEKNFEAANVDGIFGIHLAQEQLTALLEKISEKCLPEKLSNFKELLERLASIRDRLQRICEKAIPGIEKKYSDYFKKVSFAFQKNVWKFLSPSRLTNNAYLFLEVKNFEDEKLNESFSDHCLNEWDKKGCKMSTACWEYATEPNHSGYVLTHQYLYVLFGKLHGCEKQMDEMAKKYAQTLTTNGFLTMFCTNIFKDSQQIVKANFPKGDRDLFMEQIGLCGITGYNIFFQLKWIEEIISWQQPSGCFSKKDQLQTRLKREELEMPDGCFAHKTTVALIALQQSARYLLEPSLQSNCQNWNDE